MKQHYILKEPVINWYWLVEFVLEDGEVTINRHWREHGSPHRSPNPTASTHPFGYELIEDDKRHVTGLRMVENGLMTDVYPVVNSQHVFSYDGE